MNANRSRAEIEAAFAAACRAELEALKPGNVHKFAPGHGMDIHHFERAADAAAPWITDPALSIGKRILEATKASFAATGVNTNLGIVLLCAPLAKAAAETNAEMGLRRRLAVLLSMLDRDDAAAAFEAIRIANPAGLGKADTGDVKGPPPEITLIEAMHLAKDRDRIANAYVTAYSDVFDFAQPVFDAALEQAASTSLAVSTLHMALMSEFEDSHIVRKFGLETAEQVKRRARDMAPHWRPAVTSKSLKYLAEFDSDLKKSGLNPGTTADFVVTAIFVRMLSGRSPL